MLHTPHAFPAPANGSGSSPGERQARIPRFAEPREAGEWPEQIAMISHELRNSLAVIRNAARVLGMPVPNGIDGVKVLIERHVGQMARHIDDLLALELRGSGGLRLRRSSIDLRVVAQSAIDGVASDLARRGHRLTVKLPSKAVCIYADSARLEQVFTNLLMNAGKYTPKGGDIALMVDCRTERARVRIRDSGIGIAPAMLARIFEIYEQVDAYAPHAEGGHGIGLAVARNLVGLHGGTVNAASAGPGLGSEFTVLLPLFR